MAFFRLEIKSIKRSAGQRATAAAAYRAGERIQDERTGALYDYSRRKDVTHTEVFLPSWFTDSPVEWARNRTGLWNAAEAAEKRSNSTVAREFQVALPAELAASQRLALAQSFARDISDRYGIAVDLTIHDPKAGSDPRHFHAHLLATTREVTPSGLGAKAGLDMAVLERAKWGLANVSEEYTAVRERWATLTNEALRDANIDASVDHRSLAAHGIDRQPIVHIPMEFYRGKLKDLDPAAHARLREEYRARLSARAEHANAPAAPGEQSSPPAVKARAEDEHPKARDERPEPRDEQARAHDAQGSSRDETPVDTRSVEAIRRDAVQSWLLMRPREAESSLETRTAANLGEARYEERSAETRIAQPAHSERESERDAAPSASPTLEDDAAM